MGVLYQMGASCRDRLARRPSGASAASGQPDPERVSVFLYILFILCAAGSECCTCTVTLTLSLYTVPYLSFFLQLALGRVTECSAYRVGFSSWVPQSNEVP